MDSTFDAVEVIVPRAVPTTRATDVRTLSSFWFDVGSFGVSGFGCACSELATVGPPDDITVISA